MWEKRKRYRETHAGRERRVREKDMDLSTTVHGKPEGAIWGMNFRLGGWPEFPLLVSWNRLIPTILHG
jgi:hypothetical protein